MQALELHPNLAAIGMLAQNVDDGVGIKPRRVTGALLLVALDFLRTPLGIPTPARTALRNSTESPTLVPHCA